LFVQVIVVPTATFNVAGENAKFTIDTLDPEAAVEVELVDWLVAGVELPPPPHAAAIITDSVAITLNMVASLIFISSSGNSSWSRVTPSMLNNHKINSLISYRYITS
jgi:hypothetical protein